MKLSTRYVVSNSSYLFSNSSYLSALNSYPKTGLYRYVLASRSTELRSNSSDREFVSMPICLIREMAVDTYFYDQYVQRNLCNRLLSVG